MSSRFALISAYERRIEGLLGRLAVHNIETAIEMAALPETIRGFGQLKANNLDAARAREVELLARLERAVPPRAQAA